MEARTDSSTPRKIYADKLCKDAVVCVLFGICLFVFCIFLDYVIRYNPNTLMLTGGLLVSFVFIYIVGPIFGFSALIDITIKWKTITNPDYISSNPERVYITLKRFIITSLLFILFVALLALFFGGTSEYIMRAYFFIWFPITLIALVMALTSWKLSRRISKEIPSCVDVLFTVILSIAVMALGIRTTSYVDYLRQRIKYSAGTPTFSGGSDSLSQTIIVPALDSPLTDGKNIIWCSSFQLAWNKMKDDVIGEPVQVVGAEELATRLNSAKQSAADLEPESFYAAAGRVKQGIIDEIKKDMATKFPSYSMPDFNDIADIPDAILSYSYLIANVPFKYPFLEYEDEFYFTDSSGTETNVSAFGVWESLKYSHIRDQVEILYCNNDDKDHNPQERINEFVIDLCKNSSPDQVVAAIVEPKESLEETIMHINTLIENFKNSENRNSDLGPYDAILIPEMFWEIDHRFDELVDRVVTNADPPMPIVEARQGIKLRLDRYGATLESELTLKKVAPIPRNFRFDRPFLVYMKMRDCEQPFFVMWVDNAELLSKK